MLLRNLTPFQPIQFDSRDEQRNDFGVIVLRGTFSYAHGERLKLVQEQEPVLLTDEYYGEPSSSSLHLESGLAPFKPKTDVLLTGQAHSPSGFPEQNWDITLRFGSISRTLTVTGPRVFSRSMGRYHLEDPMPAKLVPVRYENAFGGSFADPKSGEVVKWEANPVGTGYFAPNENAGHCQSATDSATGQKQIQFWRADGTVGLGPIPPAWTPRADRVGTFDSLWERTRWPDLPEDFSFEFYNTASTGLTLPEFATGTETVELINLTPERSIWFSLPGFELATLMRFEDGNLVPGPVFLDTVHVETERQRVYLTWRGVFPVNVPLRVLEVRVKVGDDSGSPGRTRPVATGVR